MPHRPALIVIAVAVALGTSVVRAEEAKPEQPLDPNRLEPALLPALSYDSDYGLGLGAIANLVRFSPDLYPYAWNLEVLASVNLKLIDGNVEVPLQQHYITLEIPGLLGGRLRSSTRLEFDRASNEPYYGTGGGSPSDPQALAQNSHVYDVDRIYPTLRSSLRGRLASSKASVLDAFVGVGFEWNWINVYSGSKLQYDLDNPPANPALRPRGTTSHGLATGAVGILFDCRDHESVPTRGQIAELSVRIGEGIRETFLYGGATAEQSFFIPVWAPYLVIAGRTSFDFMFGDPPFYELGQSGGLVPWTSGGGAFALRGIRDGRYAGKIKLVGNLEARSMFLPFTVLKQRFRLGAVAFLDAGRFFADYKYDPALDGPVPGIKLGTGGGLRLQWGEHFIIRLDYGYSPTERTDGIYIGVHHVF